MLQAKRTSTARQRAFKAKTTWRAAINSFLRSQANQLVRKARNSTRGIAWTEQTLLNDGSSRGQDSTISYYVETTITLIVFLKVGQVSESSE